MSRAIDLNGAKRVHFIGIGGISMSGLAEALKRDGFTVSGSDAAKSEITERLRNLGIPVSVPNSAENITDDIELAVYTAAVKPDNPEYRAAAGKRIPLLERAALIGMMLGSYAHSICVAGTHGKTTTTSLVAEVLLAAGLDPTVSIGGHMNRGGMNYRVGDSSYFVLEACEYNNSYHHWRPKVGIILNIEADHLDFFENIDNIISSFAKFAANIRPDGFLIINKDMPCFAQVSDNLPCEVVTFGAGGARFHAENIEYKAGEPSFDVFDGERKLARVNLKMPGKYNMLNALACFAAASALGIDAEVTADALSGAKGTKRRFERKGMYGGAYIIDDYAHHPTEIRSCLAAARKTSKGKILCLFQPHTYTRTKELFDELAGSFADADLVILLPIYAAREKFDAGISSEKLAEAICGNGIPAVFAENFDKAGKELMENVPRGGLIITMGAGDVYKVGDGLLRQ